MTMRLPHYPPPLADGHSRPFYDGLAQGELRLPTCPSCNRSYWYPPQVMPCHPDVQAEWRSVSPMATVYSFTRIERSLLPGAKRSSTPYTVVMAEPIEAPHARIIGILVEAEGEGGSDEDRVACGDRVRLLPLEVGGHVIPGFVRVG